MTKTREIQISKNIALHHIYSQAGSVEKAISEAVMNAVDAKANEIHITIAEDGTHYTIVDNGRGFADENEITECFGTLGFDHQTEQELAKERVFGSFGLGRAQLWAWSRNTWKSGPFRMSVDIEANGLNYELLTDAPPIKGCTLEGEFYKPLQPTDIATVRRSLKELTQYMDITIHFNGDIISAAIGKQKWNKKTPEAVFKFTESGPLKVYNRGMLVREYPVSRFGVSGIVVSLKTLTLNVARNDVMLNRCTVFPAIVEVLKEQARKVNTKSNTSLNDNDRLQILRQILTDFEAPAALRAKPVVKSVDGRHYSINQIMNRFRYNITVGDKDYSPLGETITHMDAALVISPSYMQQLDFTPEDFVDALNHNSYTDQKFILLPYTELADKLDSPVQVIAEKQLTRKQKAMVKMANKLNWLAYKTCNPVYDYADNGMPIQRSTYRNLYFGKLRGARAWTDGTKSIGIDPDYVVRELDSGISGFLSLAMTLVHEYAHDHNSGTGQHSHDVEFYKRYHDMSSRLCWQMEDMINNGPVMYARELVKAGLSIPKSVARAIPEKHESRLMKEIEKRDLLAE